MQKFYDTCTLLRLQDLAFADHFLISSETLRELENIKTARNKDDDIKFKARSICRLLDEREDMYDVVITNSDIIASLDIIGLPTSTDNLILSAAKQHGNVTFVSDDIACRLTAKHVFGLDVEKPEVNKKEEYIGYKEVTLNESDMANFYSNINQNTFDLLLNQYIILKNENDEIVDKRKWDGTTNKIIQYRQISNDMMGKTKPRNVQQELAFDLLQDFSTSIKILTGCYGSGKDLLMISVALDAILKKNKFDKLIWVRNNVEVKNSKPIGFLPGSMEDKLRPYAQIIADHVGGDEGLSMLMGQGKIELRHLGLIRGRDIKNSIIMCSEAENLTTEHVQLLLGRVAEGSALWMNGDFRQVDDRVFETNNGLLRAIDRLKGNKNFGFVKLAKSERSETAAMADLLD